MSEAQRDKPMLRYRFPQSISIKFFDIYQVPVIEPVEIKRLPRGVSLGAVFDREYGLDYEVKLLASKKNFERAKYVRLFTEWLRKRLEQWLSQFEIPNEVNFVSIPISLEHVEFSDQITKAIEESRKTTHLVIVLFDSIDVDLNGDNVVPLKWDEDKAHPIWSISVLQIVWKSIGRICLARAYIDNERYEQVFGDKAFEDAIKNGLNYYNDGQSSDISQPLFIAPKFQIPQKIEANQ